MVQIAISYDESLLALAFKRRISIYNRQIMEKVRWFDLPKTLRYLSYNGDESSESSSSSSSDDEDDLMSISNSSSDSDSDSERENRRAARKRARANKLKALAFTRDDGFLILGYNNLRVEIWDISICHHVHTFCLWKYEKFDKWNLPSISTIKVSKNNAHIIVGTTDGRATSLNNIFETQSKCAITAHPFNLSPYTAVSNLITSKLIKQ